MSEDFIRKTYLSYGEIASKIAPNFEYVTEDLKRSGLRYTLIEYLSLSIFVSLIVFVVELPIITLILSFFIHVVFAILLSFVFSGAGAVIIFFLFTTYPKARVSDLAAKIDKSLPFSVSYMTAAASSDAPPITIFKSVIKLDEYPELKEQGRNIIRDVDGLGMDILSALRRESRRTPSKEFKDLLLGIETTINSGADLIKFLNNKSISLFNDYQRKIKTYANTLSMIIEMYITIIIVGPIFFTILSSVMSMMGGIENILAMQVLVSFILIPAISTILAFYISISSP
jgi:flagellar protein FlaJ